MTSNELIRACQRGEITGQVYLDPDAGITVDEGEVSKRLAHSEDIIEYAESCGFAACLRWLDDETERIEALFADYSFDDRGL